MEDESPKVADYFVSVGLNNVNKPETDTATLEPITELAIIFKSLGEQPPEGFECIDLTPSGLPADLNHGSIRTQSCFLCYKRGRDKPPLTDIGVLFEGRQHLMQGCDIVHKTPSKHVANVNNGNNMRIFITYRRASPQFSHSSLAVIEICVIVASKGEKPPHAFCKIEKNLNQGLVGSEVYLCYRKSLLRSNTLSYDADILSRYPVEDQKLYPLPDSIPLFCLPLGAVIECWPEKAQYPLPIFSTFALTDAKGETIYGGGVTFFEEFDTTNITKEVSELIAQQQEVHKDTRVVPQTNRCICLLSRYPFFDAFRRFLLSLYRLSVSGAQNIPIERYITHFIHQVPFPTPQKPIVCVQLTHEGFEITQPNEGPLPVSGASFTDFLRCLNTDKALTLLCCILLEQKILVHSLRSALLTSVCEALTSLIFPFRWKCPYIPLCPLKLADVLTAPIPFIVGVDSRYFDQGHPDQIADVTCVDLDTSMITQGIDPSRIPASAKLLPKKAAKCLKDKLDELFPQLGVVKSEDLSSAVDMAPLDDVASNSRKKALERSIQEAFLRFHAQILYGYKQYLLPITSQPGAGARDISSLFDLQGFMKSRPRGTERFYQALTKTQLFGHFIESRSLSSANDVFVFFDDCIDKCDTPARLLTGNNSSSTTTVVVTPPDLSGLPPGETYTYKGFPKLSLELLTLKSPVLQNVKNMSSGTPPRSPSICRTPHERHMGNLSAKKQANSPTLWASCLLGHCYTIWFIHLPALLKHHKKKQKVLNKAFQIISRMNKSKAKLPDEVCYRTLIQLAGNLNHPALAVKVLFEMKRCGVQINAITWGDYHKAVLEGDWKAERLEINAQHRWNKIRIVFMAMFAFMEGARKKKPQPTEDVLINLQPDSKENEVPSDNNLLVSTENCNVGNSLDAGYGSGPISTDGCGSEPDLYSSSFRNSHRRNFSNMSQLSESSMEDLGIKPMSAINRTLLTDTRRQSEISFSSNDFIPMGSSFGHNESLTDSNIGSLPGSLVDLQNAAAIRKPGIALEAAICSCQICMFCHKIIYDEEIMASWSPEDSNLNIVCPFCQTKKVPNLQIDVRDFRGINSKACSSNSLGSSSSSSTTKMTIDSTTKAPNAASAPVTPLPSEGNLVDIPPDSPTAPPSVDSGLVLATDGNLVDVSLDYDATPNPPTPQDSNIDLLQDFLSATPTQTSPNNTLDATIPSNSNDPQQVKNPFPPHQHKKSNSMGNPNLSGAPLNHHKKSHSMGSNLFGAPLDNVVNHHVPYLSPLVLRKELENLLKNHGESMLNEHRIVDEKPIIFWNLLWYFRRLNLPTHLPSLLLQSYSEKTDETVISPGEVRICTSWDLNRQTKEHIPLYMLWNLPEDRQKALTQLGHTPKSVLDTICNHIQENDVHIPMKMLLDERSRRQQQNPDMHWSLYRELLFLSLVSCGAENIDIDAFDREYAGAYRDKQREYSEILHPDDKSPRPKAVYCREAFEPPTLQIRRAQLYQN